MLLVKRDRCAAYRLGRRSGSSTHVAHDDLDTFPIVDFLRILIRRVVHVVEQHQRLRAALGVLDNRRVHRWTHLPTSSAWVGSVRVSGNSLPVDAIVGEVSIAIEVEIRHPIAPHLPVVLVTALQQHGRVEREIGASLLRCQCGCDLRLGLRGDYTRDTADGQRRCHQ